MWSYFGSIYYSDSNLNRYEVHPTRTVSEGTGPEFFTHFTVGEIKPDRLIGLCLKSNKKAHDYLYIFFISGAESGLLRRQKSRAERQFALRGFRRQSFRDCG